MAVTIDGTLGVSLVQDGVVTAADLSSTLDLTGKTVTLPAGTGGKVLQVVSTTKTDTFTTNPSLAWVDVTGMSVSITPSSATNKVLILIDLVGGGVAAINTAQYRVLRDSTLIYAGDAAGSRSLGFGSFIAVDAYTTGHAVGMFLDSPSTTSAITYKIQVTSNNTIFINRTSEDSDTLLRMRCASTITLMEIAA